MKKPTIDCNEQALLNICDIVKEMAILSYRAGELAKNPFDHVITMAKLLKQEKLTLMKKGKKPRVTKKH